MSAPRALRTREEQLVEYARRVRASLPTLVSLGISTLVAVPLFVSGPFWPHWGVLCVYHWSTHRPDLMPPPVAFGFGLVLDVWMGTPFGLNATLFLAMAALVASQYAAFAARPFIFAWAVAIPALALFEALSWALLQLAGYTLDPQPFLVQTLSSALAYPLVCGLCALVQRWAIDRWIPPLDAN